MKKLMYLFVAAIMFAFTACGGGETATEEVAPAATEEAAPAATEEAAPAATEEAAPAATEEVAEEAEATEEAAE